MIQTNFQALKASGSEGVFFEYFFMYFYGSNLRPLARGHLGPWDLYLNNLVELYYAMLHTKFQTSGPSGSEVEDFLTVLCISMV